MILDKKTRQKKAVILPYEEYSKLVKQSATKESLKNGGFSKFVGVLSQDFQTDDAKYQEIVK